jgi:hypothetical protein
MYNMPDDEKAWQHVDGAIDLEEGEPAVLVLSGIKFSQVDEDIGLAVEQQDRTLGSVEVLAPPTRRSQQWPGDAIVTSGGLIDGFGPAISPLQRGAFIPAHPSPKLLEGCVHGSTLPEYEQVLQAVETFAAELEPTIDVNEGEAPIQTAVKSMAPRAKDTDDLESFNGDAKRRATLYKAALRQLKRRLDRAIATGDPAKEYAELLEEPLATVSQSI